MFENKMVEGIYYSRFIASWTKMGGGHYYHHGSKFQEWLKSLVINGRHLTGNEIHEICNLADNGKLELQESAKRFIEK